MNKKKALLIIGLAVLLISALVIYINSVSDKYRWNIDYNQEVDQPYSFGIFYHLLEKREGTKKLKKVGRMLKYEMDSIKDNSAYIYLDNSFLEHPEENKLLMDYVARGNNALISVEYLPSDFLDSLTEDYFSYSDEYKFKKGIKLEFDTINGKGFSFYKRHKEDTVFLRWHGIPEQLFESEFKIHGFEPLAYFETLLDTDEIETNKPAEVITEQFEDTKLDINSSKRSVCFFKLKYGKGAFYFNTVPVTLANIYLTEEQGYNYTNKLLADFDVEYYYWDEYRYVPSSTGKPPELQSPFKYIYSQKSLRWAMYVIVLGILLYLFFGAKRKQKIMPLLEENTNSSIEYAKAVSMLYFQTKSHRFVAEEISRLFYNFIRHKYGLSGKLTDSSFIEILAKKSSIKKTDIEKINKHYIKIRFNEVASAEDLSAYHYLIEEFYKKAK